MLKRTSINKVNSLLSENPSWNVLDIGCGYRPNKYAKVLADVQNFSDHYKDKKFVQIREKILPFRDKEFDFIIASHVIEHINDFEFFIKELERISSSGYIELPTRLGDNLVFENKNDHIWWFNFDDNNNEIIASKRNQLIDPFITVATAKNLENIFRESLILELIWEKKINYRIDEKIMYKDFKKISFLQVIKKYFSKKVRSLFK